MKLFKVKKRKVWHIMDSRLGSLCNNSLAYDRKKAYGHYGAVREPDSYRRQVDPEYVEVQEVREIPRNLHDSLCKACVMRAFEVGMVKVVAK